VKISSRLSTKTFGQISKGINPFPVTTTRTKNSIQITPEYSEIKNLIESGNKIIFVTGGAGTGKSTFVKWIESQYSGKVAITAPTGIAALTVSGMTIHRMFKFPPAWIIKSDVKIDSKSIIPKIDILIIDEVSMVNANVLDRIDQSCKMHRKNQNPFGGLVVIMVGDLFQLPPIVTQNEKPMFDREYRSAKFFAAKSVSDSHSAFIELKSSFRHNDEKLIELLGNLREGQDIKNSVEQLNAFCKITNSPPQGAVFLATRNADVNEINSSELAKLAPPEKKFYGELKGKFLEKQLPVPNEIIIRKGAQVVMTNNSKYWVNGSIGIIDSFDDERVNVKILRTKKIFEVRAYTWKNYEYIFNKKTNEVERQEVGTYTQMPFTLAWAMTIHKSQGLTLDKVHIDLGIGAFETGKTYVAFSRARALSDITMARSLRVGDILIDKEAVKFYKYMRE
jgi:ATP-dependent exoDNAse (exonuclease V) alpha subunit